MARFTEGEQLRAWNAWKDVCFVHGVGKSQGDLPPIGTDKDEECLVALITKAFKDKLFPFMPLLANIDDGKSSLDALDCAQEFDDSLVAYKLSETPGHERYKKGHYGERGYERKAKAWKDSVWAAVAASDDPPTKVINGKLIGPRGVINQVVEDWLLANYSCSLAGKMLTMDKYSDESPRETSKANSAESSGMDENEIVAAESISPGSMDSADESCEAVTGESSAGEAIPVPSTWLAELEKAFKPRICCMLYAKIMGIKIYDDAEVLGALGVSKSTAAAELKRFLENCEDTLSGLCEELKDWLHSDAAGRKFFWAWLKKRCKLEKAGDLILSREAAMKSAV